MSSSSRAQVRVPAPARGESGRPEPGEPVEASYTTNRIRLQLPDGAVDLVPVPGASATDGPSRLGIDGPVFVINAGLPSGVLATMTDNARSVERLIRGLRPLGWEYWDSVVFPETLAWVERAVALNGIDELGLETLTFGRRLPGVHRWDQDGLSFWPATRRPILGPVPVTIRPVVSGCPMRLSDRGEACVPEGGPWVGASIERRLWWDAHRGLLVSALGCSVCGAERSGTGAVAMVELHQPSRHGGWAPGRWLTVDEVAWPDAGSST